MEYRRSILVYQAARRYDLYDLETYAKKYIEMFGESTSIFDIWRLQESYIPNFTRMRLGLPATSTNNFELLPHRTQTFFSAKTSMMVLERP
jgi:hypothetical protein